MKKKVVIVGAGGHAKVVADAILQLEEFELVGFVDANVPMGNLVFNDLKVICTQNDIDSLHGKIDCLAMGIGNLAVRQKLSIELSDTFQWTSVIHPKATVARNCEIGRGAVVLANAVVSSETKIGDFCIIDAGTIVDHEAQIGDFCHLSIGTLVGSNSLIDERTKTELGQIIPPFSKI